MGAGMITIFVHVPKTAGTTLKVMAEDVYKPDEILPIYADDITRAREVVASLAPETIARLKLIRGHFAYGIHEELPEGIPYQYITMLRKPLSRVRSLYNYIVRSKGHPLHQAVIRMSVGEFVTSGVSAETVNGMVYQLSGLHGELPQRPHDQFTRPDVESLLAAAGNLDKFAFVGLAEKFDYSMVALRKLLDWPDKEYPPQNTSRSSVQLQQFDEAVINNWNALDGALYHHADMKWGR